MSQWGHPPGLPAIFATIVVVACTGMLAQSTVNKAVGSNDASQAGPVDDPEFARVIKERTSKPEFSSPLVDHLPKVVGVPSPRDILGHHIGRTEDTHVLRRHPQVLPGAQYRIYLGQLADPHTLGGRTSASSTCCSTRC